MKQLWNRMRDRLNRERLSSELDEELRFHQQMLERDARATGLDDERARQSARRRLGNDTTVREESRAAWSFPTFENLTQDVKYGARALRRSPAFTITAVLTLAIGIGANSAIFSVLYRAVIATLPVREPDKLVRLVVDRGGDRVNQNLSWPVFRVTRESAKTLSGIVAQTNLDVALGTSAGAERVRGGAVSRGFFTTLGVTLEQGRDFLADEERLGAPASVIVGHALATRLDLTNRALGALVTLNGQSFTVVGIAPAEFTGIMPGFRQDLWMPVGTLDRLTINEPAFERSSSSWIDVVGRLAPNASIEQAQAELQLFDKHLVDAELRPDNERALLLDGSHGLTFRVSALQKPLLFLMGAVALVLLIACANVANLMLARANARRREIAIRLAIGAGRWRLVRQLLAESTILAFAGGAAGLILSWWGVRFLLSSYAPVGGQLALDTSVDITTVGFTAAASLCTALLFGLVPALKASRPSLVPTLKGGDVRARSHLIELRSTLVIAQVALSLTLATGSMLFLRSLQNLKSLDVGFTPSNALLASIDLEQAGYTRERGIPFLTQLFERLRAVPGIDIASGAKVITPNPGGSHWGGVRVEGYAPASGQQAEFDANNVAPGYFSAMNVVIKQGRAIAETDISGAPLVAVVNEAFVHEYFGTRSAIGQHIYVGTAPNEQAIEIVGVAHDGKYRELRESRQANVYFPLQQQYSPRVTLVLRTDGDAAALTPVVRREVAALDPTLAIFDVRTLREHLASATSQDSLVASLSSAFGATALLLAALGLFGVMAYNVSQQTRDIGVRMALGARPRDILRRTIGGGARLVALGLVLGCVGVLGAGRFAAGMLYGIQPNDGLSIVASAGMLALAALVAMWLPARRAARVDPLIALRSE